MSKNTLIKLIFATVFLCITIIFIIFGNEMIFPSALVAFLLVLTLIGDSGTHSDIKGKSSQWAVIVFSILVSVLNILVPVFLPIVASGLDFSNNSFELTTSVGTTNPQILRDHFIQVTINDMHEMCYATCLLLIINLVFLVIFNKRQKESAGGKILSRA